MQADGDAVDLGAGRARPVARLDLVEKARGRRHRAHRVRARRADADLEQVENRKEHATSSLGATAQLPLVTDVSAPFARQRASRPPTLADPPTCDIAYIVTCRSKCAGNPMAYSMLLSTADLAALAFFLAVWVFHALAAGGKLFSRVSLSTAMNAQREAWMRTMARRDLRMIDTSIMLGLAAGHGLLRLERADRDRRLFRASRRERPGAQTCWPTCRLRQRVTPGLRDQGDRPDPASRLCLLQVRLVLPAVQLLLDPDRRRAGA